MNKDTGQTILLAFILLAGMGLFFWKADFFKEPVYNIDCSFMVPAYKYELIKKIEDLKAKEGEFIECYDEGWNDGLNYLLYRIDD